jgi:hypothetical protein
VKLTARKNSAYWERAGICPQRTAPISSAPRNRGMSMATNTAIAASTAETWYTEKPMRVIDGTK